MCGVLLDGSVMILLFVFFRGIWNLHVTRITSLFLVYTYRYKGGWLKRSEC